MDNKEMNNSSNPAENNTGSLDLEMGELSQESSDTTTQELEITAKDCTANQDPSISPRKSIFDTWARTLLLIPLTIITNLFAALWAVNGNQDFAPGTFTYHLFFFVVMLNFYASIVGIVLWPVFRKVAKGFYLTAFLCSLLSLTILFGAILPNGLNCVPWILMAFVVLVLLALLALAITNSFSG